MDTTLAAVVLALAGVVAVVGVAWAFYLIGRAEDRDRAAAEACARRPPPPEPKRSQDEPAHRNGHIARERRRPLPPRRPQR